MGKVIYYAHFAPCRSLNFIFYLTVKLHQGAVKNPCSSQSTHTHCVFSWSNKARPLFGNNCQLDENNCQKDDLVLLSRLTQIFVCCHGNQR